jgi:hypothetical protein
MKFWGTQQVKFPVGRSSQLGVKHRICVCSTCSSFNMRPCLSSTNCDCFLLTSLYTPHRLHRIHPPVTYRYWRIHSPAPSIPDDHRAGLQPAMNLTYSLYYDNVMRCLRLQCQHKPTQCGNIVVYKKGNCSRTWWIVIQKDAMMTSETFFANNFQ